MPAYCFRYIAPLGTWGLAGGPLPADCPISIVPWERRGVGMAGCCWCNYPENTRAPIWLFQLFWHISATTMRMNSYCLSMCSRYMLHFTAYTAIPPSYPLFPLKSRRVRCWCCARVATVVISLFSLFNLFYIGVVSWVGEIFRPRCASLLHLRNRNLN